MRRKITLTVLIVAIVVQLLLPVGMIVHSQKAESDLEKYGVEYKFKINAGSLIDGTLYFNLEDRPLYWGRWSDNKYGIILVDSEGYAYFEDFIDSRPPIHNYVRFTEETRKKLNRFEIETDVTNTWIQEESAYAIVKVFNGDIQVVEIFIDDITINEWVEIPPITEEYIEDENLFGEE